MSGVRTGAASQPRWRRPAASCRPGRGGARSSPNTSAWGGGSPPGGRLMGMDFVAMLKHRGPDERLSRVLDRLEAGSPAEVQALARLMHDRGLGLGREETAAWEFTS